MLVSAGVAVFFRIDLTEESRYTMKPRALESLDDDVYVEVYLEGNINAGFQRLYKAVGETLENSGCIPITKYTTLFWTRSCEGTGKPKRIYAGVGREGHTTDEYYRQYRWPSHGNWFPGCCDLPTGAEEGVMLVKGIALGARMKF